MPRMPLSGVRISWLMLARKSLLARLAVSAVSLASFKAELRRFDLLLQVIGVLALLLDAVFVLLDRLGDRALVRSHQHVAFGEEVLDSCVKLFVDLVQGQ